MKKLALLISLSAISILFMKMSDIDSNKNNNESNLNAFEYPEKVKAVIDSKCYDCHSVKGKSDDAKKALIWDDLPTEKLVNQIATLDEIVEVLDEGKMPPKKIVKKSPQMELSPEESQILKVWAENTSAKLLE